MKQPLCKSHSSASHVQAELLQQEIINRQRLSVALERLVDDLPKQAEAAEDRMFMAEYVKGYQLVRLFLVSKLSSPGHLTPWQKSLVILL